MALDGRPVPLRGRERKRPETGLPPHDIAAEEAVVAALLLDDDACGRVESIVRAENFFREQNGWIFAACMAVWMRGEPVTIPTVAHELDRAGRLDAAGGETYLVEVAGQYFTAVGVEAHARIVARDATYRRLIQSAGQIAALAYEGGADLESTLDTAEALIASLRVHGGRRIVVSVDGLVGSVFEGDEGRLISSGFASIDRMTRGLRLGQLSVWGGRQDSAKSALMMSCAYRQVDRYGVPVLYLPFEDTVDEVLTRLAGGLVGLSWDTAHKRAQSRVLSAEEWAEFRARWRDPKHGPVAALRGLPLHMPEVGQTPATWEDVLLTIRLGVLQYGVQCVWLDYLDVAPKPSRRGASTADLVAQQMGDLQNLAVRHGVHIAVGSQVSNEGERDEGGKHPPKPHRLLDSGAKARVARLILMLALQPVEETRDHKRVLHVSVEKLKGFAVGRRVTLPDGHTPALYLDALTGLVGEVGE